MKKHMFSTKLKTKCLLNCAQGMDFLHKSGLLHRDLKPENLLVLQFFASPDFLQMVSLDEMAAVVCKITGTIVCCMTFT